MTKPESNFFGFPKLDILILRVSKEKFYTPWIEPFAEKQLWKYKFYISVSFSSNMQKQRLGLGLKIGYFLTFTYLDVHRSIFT